MLTVDFGNTRINRTVMLIDWRDSMKQVTVVVAITLFKPEGNSDPPSHSPPTPDENPISRPGQAYQPVDSHISSNTAYMYETDHIYAKASSIYTALCQLP